MRRRAACRNGSSGQYNCLVYEPLPEVDRTLLVPNTGLGMPKTLTEITRDAAELPAADRLKLARILLDLSEARVEDPAGVQAAWDHEIERRLEELRSGKVKAVPLEQVKRNSTANSR